MQISKVEAQIAILRKLVFPLPAGKIITLLNMPALK